MIEFEILGKPVGKARARTFTRNNKSFTFTPENTRNYEDLVRWNYTCKTNKIIKGYIDMKIKAIYPVPRSYSKKKTQDCLSNSIMPDKKPDADNIAKIICDALNKVAYLDDTQIINLYISKEYGPEEKVIVSIKEINSEV